MLATQPGADLAVALTGERRGGQDLADQPHELVIADRGRRSRSWRHPRPATPGVHRGAGAPSTRHTTATGRWSSMAIWAASPAGSGPPFFRPPPQDLVLHGQLPDLAFGLPQRPVVRGTGRAAGPSGLPCRSPESRPARLPADVPRPAAPATASQAARHAAAAAPPPSSCPLTTWAETGNPRSPHAGSGCSPP